MSVVSLSAEELKRLDSVMAVLVPLMIPGTLKASLERPIRGVEALCLVMAGADGGIVSEAVCVTGLKHYGFGKTKATAIIKAGLAGLIEQKLADYEFSSTFRLSDAGKKIYRKINSNLKVLESAERTGKTKAAKKTVGTKK